MQNCSPACLISVNSYGRLGILLLIPPGGLFTMSKDPFDFAEVCRNAALAYRRAACRLEQECAAVGVTGNVAFWERAAIDAQRSAQIYLLVMQKAREAILQRLKE